MFHPLAPRARLLFHATAAVRLVTAWLPFSLGVTLASTMVWSFQPALFVGASVMLVAVLMTVWWPSLSYDRYGWALLDDMLLVRRGVLFRAVTAIPIGRVQHVDVRQGPLEQWMSLCRLHVHTASGLGADGVIPGLDLAVAGGLRDRLVAAGARVEDGV